MALARRSNRPMTSNGRAERHARRRSGLALYPPRVRFSEAPEGNPMVRTASQYASYSRSSDDLRSPGSFDQCVSVIAPAMLHRRFSVTAGSTAFAAMNACTGPRRSSWSREDIPAALRTASDFGPRPSRREASGDLGNLADARFWLRLFVDLARRILSL